MNFDLHLRTDLQISLDALADEMANWEAAPRLSEDEFDKLHQAIQTFPHTTRHECLTIAGVDGSGDYPSLTYADSFIYFTVAQATCYRADQTCGLSELAPVLPPVFDFAWIPESQEKRFEALDRAFTALAGLPLDEVIESSDYRTLKSAETRRAASVAQLRQNLLRPHASDAGNLGIQLRTTGELGAALRLIKSELKPNYVLVDTTFSLPLLNNPLGSMFYEHLKRLCCVEARKRGTVFLALSKSHGLPSIEEIERTAAEVHGTERGVAAEHWYLRLPEKGIDGWELSLTAGRRLPPPGAVSYLTRFHHTTPTLRLDLDRTYWQESIRGQTVEETQRNEQKLFSDLDYACHDQRCYGYPYPLKAGHDRASLTKHERVVLRKQIIDAAVKKGMKRSLFRDASIDTGHQ
jgi:hypothetical protein